MPDVEIDQLVADISAAIKHVDVRRPQAANARTGHDVMSE
jgi:hypothetical protein